jgi:PilZ domain-containing protein
MMQNDKDTAATNFADAEPVERRQLSRHRTLKAGSITFNRAAVIDCRVRNLSPAGALLEVASQVGIPEQFVLVIESDRLRQPCRVIWRTATRLGVSFSA